MRHLIPVYLLLAAAPVMAQEAPAARSAVDGTCQALQVAGSDLSGQCGTALAQLRYADGRVTLGVGTRGEARMVLFMGQGAVGGPAWSTHQIDHVYIGPDGTSVPAQYVAAEGTCIYLVVAENSLTVNCQAGDAAGATYRLDYRSNGNAPADF